MINRPSLRWTLVAILYLGCIGTFKVSAQQMNNYVMQAIPTPTPVVVDGQFDEWDTSGEILMCYDVQALLDTYSVKVAAMYDQTYLYLLFRFQDATPMVNHIDPLSHPGDGWRSDAVQLRIWAKPDAVPMHVDAYYDTDHQKPAVFIQYTTMRSGEDPKLKKIISNALKEGVKEAFSKNADGKGYVQELALPWKLVMPDHQSPKAGQSIRMGIEALWGNASGGDKGQMPKHRLADLINRKKPQRDFFWVTPSAWGELKFAAKGKLAPTQSIQSISKIQQLQKIRYSTSGPVKIAYKLPKDGYVTLVIEKPDGTRVRNLISDYPRQAGENVDFWDGQDDTGRKMPKGSYRVRGLYHQAFDALYEFSFGNPGYPQWPTTDTTGSWLSNHAPPMATLADNEHIYITSPYSEGPHPLIALDQQGNKVWGGLARGNAGYMARSGNWLYVINDHDNIPAYAAKDLNQDSSIELIRIDPATGREAAFPDGKNKHVLSTWNLQKQGASRPWIGKTVAEHGFDADWAGINAQGMTALNKMLYVSLHFENKLLKVNAQTGQVIGEIALSKPAGLVADKKRLLAISGLQVVVVDPATGKATPLITTNLKAPIDLALDKQGNIYVSDWADQMCVKVFSPQGQYLRHIGKMGGRTLIGPYEPQAMLLPRGITIDTQNRLWVAENDFQPRRVSCWNTTSGQMMIEKLGQTEYGGMGARVFPDDPNHAMLLGNLVELDWDKGLWRILGTPWRPTGERTLFGLGNFSTFSKVIAYKGRRFVVHTTRYHHTSAIGISEWKDGRAIPLMAAGPTFFAFPAMAGYMQGGFDPPAILANHLWTHPKLNKVAREVVPWFFHGPRAGNVWGLANATPQIIKKSGLPFHYIRPNSNFIWSDLNNNGSVDNDEITFFATPQVSGKLPQHWAMNGWSRGVVDGQLNLYFSMAKWGADKAYHYKLSVDRWTKSGVPIYQPKKAKMIVKSRYLGQAAWVSSQGNLLTYGNYGKNAPMAMFKPDGTVAWTYPSDYTGVHGSHSAPKAKRGLLIGELGVMGEAQLKGVGQIFAIHTNMGKVQLLTADGLYLGALFRDTRSAPDAWPNRPRRGMSMGKVSNGAEWFGGQLFQRPDNAKVYVVGGRQAATVMRVSGLETIKRLPNQMITFDGQKVTPNPLLTETQRLAHQPKIMRVLAMKQQTQKTDIPATDRFSWSGDVAASWKYDLARSAEATWAVDRQNLYVCFKVKDDSPMINHGEDPSRLFKFGDAVLLELRTQPENDRRQIIPGDLRLLFSLHHGKPVAVLYDYRVVGTKHPVRFTSPVTTTSIDRVEVLKHAKIVLDRTEGGYVLRASVPLSDLRFKPKAGQRYRGDFGVVYSDSHGTQNLLRMNWSNKKTGLVSDLAMEAVIVPANWGWFEVSKTN